MKHIIVGDVHIGKGLSIGKPGVPGKSGFELNSRINDKLDILNWILEQTEKYNSKHIIITGDVYEEQRPHPTVIGLFMKWLKRCEDKGVVVDVIAGNHDIMRSGSYTASALDLVPAIDMSHANVYKDPATVARGSTLFTYIPFRDRRMYEANSAEEALDKLVEEVREKATFKPLNWNRVIVGHLSLAGALKITDEVADYLNEIFVPIERFEEMLGDTYSPSAKWNMVVMGHIHHPQVIQDKDPYVIHIGSMDRSDFHIFETDIDKTIIVLDDDGECERVVIPTRNLRMIEIVVPSGVGTTDYIVQSLDLYNKSMSVEKAIVKLIVKLAEDVEDSDRAAIEKHLYSDLNVHHICSFQESRAIAPIIIDEENRFDSSDTIVSSIGKFMDFYKANFDNDEQRDRTQALAIQCYQEYEEKQAAKTK